MKRDVTDFALYRFRYVIGYLVLLIAISGLLLFAGLYVPGGIRSEEINSIATSSSLAFTDFDSSTVINLPYHLLQRLSLALLGVSILSIKLPSILLGIATIVGVYLLAKEWFRNNIAIITTLLAATMPIFLFIAQDGTPSIYSATLSVWLLYTATLVSRRRTPTLPWKIIFFILAALNLYTPLGIYLTIAVVTTVIFHPHVRHTIKSFDTTKIVIAGTAFILALVPLLYSLAVEPTIGLELLGIPRAMPNLTENTLTVVSALFNFMGGSAQGVLVPMISLGVAIIIINGIYRAFLTRYTARSYILWLWSLMLLPFIILNPRYATYLYPLVVMMTAMGISSIISSWYKTFPRNPYARVAGLIPISVIVIGISMSGVNSYALSYTYSPELRQNFSQDIRILSDIKSNLDSNNLNLVVSEPELKLYSIYQQFDDSVSVSDSVPTAITETVVVSSAAKARATIDGKIETIITDSSKNEADRFYLYTPLEK